MHRIRKATLADISSITEIYNWAILHTTATFDTEIKSVEERSLWLSGRSDRHPVFVADGGPGSKEVVGWAALSPWSERLAYAGTAEVSVYVSPRFQGRGVGRALFEHLDGVAPGLGLHSLVSRITDGNLVSVHLHESLGFSHVGVMKEVGCKFNKHLDVYIMQKLYR